ncbi:MAG TPA: putative 2OG-Fe(II) oxygenase [Woeseiaceae bacterium]|nr:putative 2OG-Fe(II) oxygenase [Woeseiaceae bacterium]
MNLIDLFPKTIAAANLETLTPELIRRAIEYIDAAEKTGLVESDGVYTTNQQLLEHDLFREVKQEIVSLCKRYSECLCHVVEGIRICNSWGNVIEHGQSIRLHRHNNSYISGSFYLTGGSSFVISNLGFHDIFGFVPRVSKSNYRSWESFAINPEPGGIVLFPSGLYHSVAPSTSKEKRYSIAFNAVPLGTIGRPTSLLDLGTLPRASTDA